MDNSQDRSEPVAWIRTLYGEPDWGEDCLFHTENEAIVNVAICNEPASARAEEERYSYRPLTWADQRTTATVTHAKNCRNRSVDPARCTCGGRVIYAHPPVQQPPPPRTVPSDPLSPDHWYARGWNACRAALAAAPSPKQGGDDVNKAAYVRVQGQTRRHHCHWPGCDRQVPPAMWGCKEHWFKLPKPLRDAVWRAYVPGQEATQTPSQRYLAVAALVQGWIAGKVVVHPNGAIDVLEDLPVASSSPAGQHGGKR